MSCVEGACGSVHTMVCNEWGYTDGERHFCVVHIIEDLETAVPPRLYCRTNIPEDSPVYGVVVHCAD